MKVVLVFVSTLDGKVTKWGDPNVKKWSSPEDRKYFLKMMRESRLVVMGRNSFNAEPVKPSENKLVMVMTHNPELYRQREVRGKIEFTDLTPEQLVTRFSEEKYEIMHVLGGPKVAASFLKEQLVDELWLTIEPKIFGRGNILVADEQLDIELRLISCEKINSEGTMITRYEIKRGK